MEKTIGFIGGGHMASAMIGGILKSGICKPIQIQASCRSKETRERLEQAFGIRVYLDNAAVAAAADILILAIKPYQFAQVLPQIRQELKEGSVVVSIAAGQTLAMLEQGFGSTQALVRAMPNTPAQVGQAMSALCANELVEPQGLQEILELFSSFGKAQVVPEALMDTVVGVSGSSPAYVYMMIEAMADAAVADGMPRDQAYVFAAQSVAGAAQMVLQTGQHPAVLKDAVCSPGGTTIEAVAVLEEKGFGAAVIAAQRACTRKSREMSSPDPKK